MRNQGIGSWTARRARKSPHALAVLHRDRRFSYLDLRERSLRLAARLRAAGLQRGEAVAYLGPNHPAYLETLFAAGLLGAVFVPLNTRLAAAEVEYCLADSGARILIHTAQYARIAEEAGSTQEDLRSIAVDEEYERTLAQGPAEPIDEPVAQSEPCMIMYTSGTTGRPKGAVLSHGNLTWNSLNVVVDTDFRHDEVTLVSAPLFHTAALNMTCLPTLLKGGTVILEETFDEARTLELISHQGVTTLFGVPTMYQRLADAPGFDETDLSGVRNLMCGGAPVPEPLLRRYLDRGLSFVQGYGMTEASPGTLLLDADHALSKAGTAGVPHFFTDVRLTRPDGSVAGPGEPGEIEVEGPNVMLGYWGRPVETRRALNDGWLHSGDLAATDEDGYVRIVDRIKDLIISGGENVSPAQVESVLYQHPGVAECAVIGVPDERWGEVGRAVVVVREPAVEGAEFAAELLAFAAERLAKYKVPKSVVFTEALPRTGAGKVIKSALREANADGSPS
ncbi:long-chain fatty acid--CoA ligase [Actinospica sp. MGRD01-02]|uniref:Long-chain fatty acid--CoA ligase n=1 Tax=Actinospica acidithermotolerans TaxID=2828514 RepID=A0A941IJC5_9ACTN|nr:long-chain fatty acid--CoA ligase [Actinospica acidithermotolerans]MBR7830595.1 long-chain fatty acid--CoA ligase [Actinospica acidithermotolerans]